MDLILARHGNTFEPDQPSVRAGSRNDFPLVEAGRVQAKQLAAALKASRRIPAAIYAGPLKRTQEFAQIIAAELGIKDAPLIDARLNEIDYGQWSGLTDTEIVEKFGEESLANWNERSVWPNNAGWQSSPAVILAELKTLIRDVAQQHGLSHNVLFVSSNGRLRYFLDLIPGEFEKHVRGKALKIATGSLALFAVEDIKLRLLGWNLKPVDLGFLKHGSSQ